MAKCIWGPGRVFSSSNIAVHLTGETSHSQSLANCSRFALRSVGAHIPISRGVARLTETWLQINCIYQAQRFFVRQKRLLHLIHHVGERNPVFRIGKGVAAASTGMSESVWRHTEHALRNQEWAVSNPPFFGRRTGDRRSLWILH